MWWRSAAGTASLLGLRGLKSHTSNLTAVVTMADDGGSSGLLRRDMGMPPPGDLRNCLVALADDESMMSQLFKYRFPEDTGLQGHSFGNLFITALAEVTGYFEHAVREATHVLKVRGRASLSTPRLLGAPCTCSWKAATWSAARAASPASKGLLRR